MQTLLSPPPAPPSDGRGTSAHPTLSSMCCVIAEPHAPDEDASGSDGAVVVPVHGSEFNKAPYSDLRLGAFTTLPSLMRLKRVQGGADMLSLLPPAMRQTHQESSTDSDLDSEAGQANGMQASLTGEDQPCCSSKQCVACPEKVAASHWHVMLGNVQHLNEFQNGLASGACYSQGDDAIANDDASSCMKQT